MVDDGDRVLIFFGWNDSSLKDRASDVVDFAASNDVDDT